MPETRDQLTNHDNPQFFGWLSRLSHDPAISQALLTFLVFRIITLVWMWGVRQVIFQPIEPHPVLRPYLGVAMEANPWLEPWQRWDTLHYQAIAERGYSAFTSAPFAPPLYPLLMRYAGSLIGGNTLLAGILVANAAYLWALVVFYRLARDETGDPKSSTRALWYLASFPSAFFFMAAYTESLFLLAAILSLMYVRKERWWLAGCWGALASLARLPGLLLLVPLAYVALQRWRIDRRWKPWIPVLLTLVGGAAYSLYVMVGLRLPPWLPWTMQNARGKAGIGFPGANLLSALGEILAGRGTMVDIIDLAFLLFFMACFVPVWRRLPRVYSVYYLSFLAMYLLRTSQIEPLLSVSRYVLVFFPAFMVMGAWGRNPWVHRLILYSSWLGLLYLSGQFAIWGWAG